MGLKSVGLKVSLILFVIFIAFSVAMIAISANNVLANVHESNAEKVLSIVNAVAAEKGLIQTGYEAAGGHAGFEYLEKNRPEELAKQAVGRALLMLEAKPAPAGKMPVVMAGEAGGTMVHEACGHGLEADLVQKAKSAFLR